MGFTPFRDNEGNIVKRPVWLRMKRYDKKGLTKGTEAVFVDNENVEWIVPPGEVGSKHILEISLNNYDYTPIIPKNSSYSYTYVESPEVTALYPSFAPLRAANCTTIIVKGKNFICPDKECKDVTCRFSEGDEAIYKPAIWVSNTEVHCAAPKYNRPDVVPVEVSMDKEIYTNDGKEFGYYEAYVWSVKPKMVSKKGNTTIRVHGYGFVNTSEHLKVKYGSPGRPLKCKGGPCIKPARYIDKNNIDTETFPYDEVIYESTGSPLEKDEFAVEVSVYGDDFTKNNVTIFYFSEPIYDDPIPDRVPSNGNETILIPTNYRTNYTEPENPLNEQTIFKRYGNATCRFTSASKSDKIVKTHAEMMHYPIQEDDYLNAIVCPSPEWELEKEKREEDVYLDISVNDADFSGKKLVKITERLDIYRIYPPCGPTVGNTRMRIIGTGFKLFKNLHLKWGVIDSILVDEKSRDSFIYQKGKSISKDPYEDEILSLNEETYLLYENMSEYQSVYSYSPKLPNYDRTHGGQVYLSLGHANELNVKKKDTYTIHYYPTSILEYYYYQQPVLKDMRPHGGISTGNTLLTLRGAWFKYMPIYGVKPYVKIGDKVAKCIFESTVRILCRSPPNEETDTLLPVKVGLNGIDFGDSDVTYYYYYPPIINKIIPASGPESGGTRIHVLGERFSNLTSASEFKCRFTAVDHKTPPKYVNAFYENSTSIICLAPGGWGSGVTANVEITFNNEDYTDSGSRFYFYSITEASPRSSPSDVENGILTIEGSGFRPTDPIICSFDKVNYNAIEIKWDYIKCNIPKALKGAEFFGNVPLSVNINGYDYYDFAGGFTYYPQIEVSDFYPKLGPAKGHGIIKIYGNKFRADFDGVDPACRFGTHIGKAQVINSQEILCHLPTIEAINKTYKVEAALNRQSFVRASTTDEFSPYGIYDIDPYSGPMGAQTQITVTGGGFVKNGKAKCRFGVPGNYAILNAKVHSPTKITCLAPKKYEGIKKIMELPYAIPFSITLLDEDINLNKGIKPNGRIAASADYTFDPWTNTGHVFRFYKQPVVDRIDPKSCKVGEIIDVYAYANPNAPFVERTSFIY